jgi:hypothetical protein
MLLDRLDINSFQSTDLQDHLIVTRSNRNNAFRPVATPRVEDDCRARIPGLKLSSATYSHACNHGAWQTPTTDATERLASQSKCTNYNH